MLTTRAALQKPDVSVWPHGPWEDRAQSVPNEPHQGQRTVTARTHTGHLFQMDVFPRVSCWQASGVPGPDLSPLCDLCDFGSVRGSPPHDLCTPPFTLTPHFSPDSLSPATSSAPEMTEMGIYEGSPDGICQTLIGRCLTKRPPCCLDPGC